MARKHNILFFDVETAPLLAYIWHPADQYVNSERIIHDSFMLSWAAKWADNKQIMSDVLDGLEAKQQDDSRIVQGLADLIRQADVVVAHNADKFDIPVVNARVLQLGQEPLGPVKTIDTLKLAKKSFRIASKKLDYLATFLGEDGKIDTDFELWRQCYFGNEKYLNKMVKYNRQDVKVLENVYDALKPYAKGLPRLVDAERDSEFVCPFCAGTNLQKRGFHYTNASTFQRWQCQDCLRWSRSRASDKKKKVSTVPV